MCDDALFDIICGSDSRHSLPAMALQLSFSLLNLYFVGWKFRVRWMNANSVIQRDPITQAFEFYRPVYRSRLYSCFITWSHLFSTNLIMHIQFECSTTLPPQWWIEVGFFSVPTNSVCCWIFQFPYDFWNGCWVDCTQNLVCHIHPRLFLFFF